MYGASLPSVHEVQRGGTSKYGTSEDGTSKYETSSAPYVAAVARTRSAPNVRDGGDADRARAPVSTPARCHPPWT
eukprot:10022314-Heterocapsa_arctica.AAC.1